MVLSRQCEDGSVKEKRVNKFWTASAGRLCFIVNRDSRTMTVVTAIVAAGYKGFLSLFSAVSHDSVSSPDETEFIVICIIHRFLIR